MWFLHVRLDSYLDEARFLMLPVTDQSELAPAKWRGAIINLYQTVQIFGVIVVSTGYIFSMLNLSCLLLVPGCCRCLCSFGPEHRRRLASANWPPVHRANDPPLRGSLDAGIPSLACLAGKDKRSSRDPHPTAPRRRPIVLCGRRRRRARCELRDRKSYPEAGAPGCFQRK